MILKGFMAKKYFVTKDLGSFLSNYSKWCIFVQSFRIEKTI